MLVSGRRISIFQFFKLIALTLNNFQFLAAVVPMLPNLVHISLSFVIPKIFPSSKKEPSSFQFELLVLRLEIVEAIDVIVKEATEYFSRNYF